MQNSFNDQKPGMSQFRRQAGQEKNGEKLVGARR
jgi:hypothetical protein